MTRYTKKDNDGRYYIESANGKLESNIKGYTYGEAIDRFAELENADVVPKSEYDEVLSSWQKIHDSYDADCIEHYKYGRAEVAREIFEEIEKYKRIIIEGVKPVYTLKQRELEELKKKYTEGEK